MATTPQMSDIASDLRAEHDELDGFVTDLADEDWDIPTPAVGWAVRDQISHLAYFDDAATLSLEDPDAFIPLSKSITSAMESGQDPMREHLERGRQMNPEELLRWWRTARERLLAAVLATDPSSRVLWFGPPMGARSFTSARIMETWAHGQDIVDALSVRRTPTARLRHVAHLGVGSRNFSYLLRAKEAPAADVRVELAAPDGTTWAWGTEGCDSSVAGPAIDFCLVVTRRRKVSDTALVVKGESATEWMEIAQAFAGPPGPDRT